MSQMPVMYIHKLTPAWFYTESPRPSGLGTVEEQYIPVVPLSALREALKRIQFLDGYNGQRIWPEARQIIDDLLAQLGEA